MTVTFFNHACFRLSDDKITILCDPYLSGSSFNDGWDLIVEGVCVDFDFRKKNYIYISHEHPDHFSVKFLRGIPKEKRHEISIIFQETKDRRLLNFVEGLGFNTIECPDKHEIKLGDKSSIIQWFGHKFSISHFLNLSINFFSA